MVVTHSISRAVQAQSILVTNPDPLGTNTFYVSSTGNNTDGSSWDNAYTTLAAALAACGTGANDNNVIYLSAEAHDVNVTGDPTYNVNVHIVGVGRHVTSIKNDHASATAVLKFTRILQIRKLTIDCGTGEDGIILSGTNAIGSRISDCYIECDSLAVGATGITLTGAIKYAMIKDVMIHGETTNTLGLHFNQGSECMINNVHFMACNQAIHLDHANDNMNMFYRNELHNCAAGILIDAGATNNSFDDILFHGNTANVADSGTTTSYTNIHLDKKVIKILPLTASTGTVLTSKATINAYADSDIEIDAGSGFTATKPYRVTGFYLGNPSDNTATHIIQLSSGGAGVEVTFYDGGTYLEGKFGSSGSQDTESGWLAPQTRLAGNLKTENAVADTIQIWVEYEEMG